MVHNPFKEHNGGVFESKEIIGSALEGHDLNLEVERATIRLRGPTSGQVSPHQEPRVPTLCQGVSHHIKGPALGQGGPHQVKVAT